MPRMIFLPPRLEHINIGISSLKTPFYSMFSNAYPHNIGGPWNGPGRIQIPCGNGRYYGCATSTSMCREHLTNTVWSTVVTFIVTSLSGDDHVTTGIGPPRVDPGRRSRLTTTGWRRQHQCSPYALPHEDNVSPFAILTSGSP